MCKYRAPKMQCITEANKLSRTGGCRGFTLSIPFGFPRAVKQRLDKIIDLFGSAGSYLVSLPTGPGRHLALSRTIIHAATSVPRQNYSCCCSVLQLAEAGDAGNVILLATSAQHFAGLTKAHHDLCKARRIPPARGLLWLLPSAAAQRMASLQAQTAQVCSSFSCALLLGARPGGPVLRPRAARLQ